MTHTGALHKLIRSLCRPFLKDAELSAYAGLTEGEIEVMREHFSNGFDFKTTCRVLGLLAPTAKTLYHRGLNKIVLQINNLPKRIHLLQAGKDELNKLRRENMEFKKIFNMMPTSEKEKVGDVIILSIPFEQMPDISVRFLNCMDYIACKTLGDLVRKYKGRKNNLLYVPNFGKKCMAELDEILTENAIEL